MRATTAVGAMRHGQHRGLSCASTVTDCGGFVGSFVTVPPQKMYRYDFKALCPCGEQRGNYCFIRIFDTVFTQYMYP